MPGPNNIDFVHSQIVKSGKKWNGNSHIHLFSDVKTPDDISAGAREWRLTIKQNLHIKHGASDNAIKHKRQKPTLPTSATLSVTGLFRSFTRCLTAFVCRLRIANKLNFTMACLVASPMCLHFVTLFTEIILLVHGQSVRCTNNNKPIVYRARGVYLRIRHSQKHATYGGHCYFISLSHSTSNDTVCQSATNIDNEVISLGRV